MLSYDRSALDALAALLLERAGLKIVPEGYHSLRLALSARMPALGMSDAAEYVRRLRGLAGEQELRALLPYVTVGKTDFFRDPRQMNTLESRLLPECIALARQQGRKPTIWSAGCATGEEPYSLAMMLHEADVRPSEVDLLATDVNPAAIESAKAGRYPLRRLGGVSPQRLSRFFTQVEDGFEVVPRIKEYVQFEGHNLAAPVYPRVGTSSLDIILCRNVIIYFDLPTIRGLMDRFLMSLRPGGYLLLGYSESLFQVYDRFDMVEVDGSFVYRRPMTLETSGRRRLFTLAAEPPTERADSAPVSKKHAPKQRASKSSPPPMAAPPLASRAPSERLKQIGERLERGAFEEAHGLAKQLVDDEPNDLAALLTCGNIASLLGHADEAREAFAIALQREPLCVEARLYGGMAAMQVGRLEQARGEFTKALFLEPTLALGHYLLAQVLERLGEIGPARKAYKNAIEQIRHPQRPLAGHYPDMLASVESIASAAGYGLAHLEELPSRS